MTIRTGQKMYRVRGPEGLWAKKTDNLRKVVWVEDEHSATFWKKLHHLKNAITSGVFSNEENFGGAPMASFQVYEYDVVIERTGRRRRLSELHRFHEEKERDDGATKDV